MEKKKGKKQKRVNLHDSFVKHNFSTKGGMIAFLRSHLPRKILRTIDLETVRMEGNEFLPNRYRNRRQADIILSIQKKKGERVYLLVLLEAQSRHDKYMAARVLEYHAAIAFAHLRRGNDKVPLILTFVLYHGKKKWTSPQSIAHLFQDFEDYVSLGLKNNFLVHPKLEDIEKLKKQGRAAFPLMVLALQPSGAYSENLDILYPLMKKYEQDDPENIHYMASQNKDGPDVFFEKLSTFETENTKNYKNMYGLLTRKERMQAKREGMERGIEKGMERGIEKGQKVLLKRLLNKQINISLLAEVAGMTPEALQNL